MTTSPKKTQVLSVEEVEKTLSQVWCEVLKLQKIDRDANYFSLGGNSLGLMKIINAITEFDFNLELEDFFKAQTIASLAALAVERKQGHSTESRTLPPVLPIDNRDKKEKFELSAIQAGVIGNSGNMCTLYDFLGQLDTKLLKKSLDRVIERHWVLKTKFIKEGEKHYQVVQDPEVEYFFEVDLRGLPEDKLETTFSDLIFEYLYSDIDISKSPLFRCYVIRTTEEQNYFLFMIDHIVFDGVSLHILKEEICEFYNSEKLHRHPNLPEIKIQYVDFAHWEDKTYSNKIIADPRLEYWRTTLAGISELKLPLDNPRREEGARKDGVAVVRHIDKSVAEKLGLFCKENNITLYLALLSGVIKFIQELTGQNDVFVRETYSQRPAELTHTMGYFMSVLPLRVDLRHVSSATDLVQLVQERSFATRANFLPSSYFKKLSLKAEDRENLFKSVVLINYNVGNREPLKLEGIEAHWVDVQTPPAALADLFFQFTLNSGQLDYSIVGNESILKKETIQSWAEKFEMTLKEMCKA